MLPAPKHRREVPEAIGRERLAVECAKLSSNDAAPRKLICPSEFVSLFR